MAERRLVVRSKLIAPADLAALPAVQVRNLASGRKRRRVVLLRMPEHPATRPDEHALFVGEDVLAWLWRSPSGYGWCAEGWPLWLYGIGQTPLDALAAVMPADLFELPYYNRR